MEEATCRSCGAPIYWVRTQATDSLMPLDVVATENGNILLVDGKAVVLRGDLFEQSLPDGLRYQSHYVSCPNAQNHRKRGKEKK